MNQPSNRRCYNSYYVPLDTMAHASWPPTYVECDCGRLAKHIVHFKRRTTFSRDVYLGM